jgi:hypothetical protein
MPHRAVKGNLTTPRTSVYTFSSESVSEGHPDKVADCIAAEGGFFNASVA